MSTKFRKLTALLMAVILALSAMTIFAYSTDSTSAESTQDLYGYGDNYALATVSTATPGAIAVDPNIVIYNLGSREVTVGHDGNLSVDSFFDTNGHYTIQLEDDAFFPYEVQFQHHGITTVEWFRTPYDTVHIGGYTFSVYSQAVDENAITQIWLTAGVHHITVYPEAKVFTNHAFEAFSLLPLEQRNFTANLMNLTAPEMSAINISTIFSRRSAGVVVTTPEPQVLWAGFRNATRQETNHQVVDDNQPIDLRTEQSIQFIELIVDDTNQLNPSNVRYWINLNRNTTLNTNWLSFDAATTNAAGARVMVPRLRSRHTNTTVADGTTPAFVIYVDADQIDANQPLFVSLRWNEDVATRLAGADVRIYDGLFDSLDELIAANPTDLTSRVWNQNVLTANTGIYLPAGQLNIHQRFTIVMRENGDVIGFLGFVVNAMRSTSGVQFGSFGFGGSQLQSFGVGTQTSSISSDGVRNITVARHGDPFSSTYFRMTFIDLGQVSNFSVSHAVEGLFDSAIEIENRPNIATRLFDTNWENGFSVIPSQGPFEFSMLTTDGRIYRFTVDFIDGRFPSDMTFGFFANQHGGHIPAIISPPLIDSGTIPTWWRAVVHPNNLADDQPAYVHFRTTSGTRFFSGQFDTPWQALNSQAEVTAQILWPIDSMTSPSGFLIEPEQRNQTFTMIRMTDGVVTHFTLFSLSLVTVNDAIYPSVQSIRFTGNNVWSSSINQRYRIEDDIRYIDVQVGPVVDGEHDVRMAVNDTLAMATSTARIARVVHGFHDSAATINAQPNIAPQLFGPGSEWGLRLNFRERNHQFTILDTDGNIHQFVLSFVHNFNHSRHHAIDNFFHVTGANELNNVYVMPFQHDSYYAMGFQTVFFIPDPGQTVDMTMLTPTFETGFISNTNRIQGISTHAGHDGGAGEIQVSGVNRHDFSAQRPVHYSATDGLQLRNYWVTFVEQQQGVAQLFVNGINGDAPNTREVTFDNDFGEWHDIFIANIGTERMTGLTATLNDPDNIVALDDYWTVGGTGNDELAGFTTTNRPSGTNQGELPNVAKLRIVQTGLNTGVFEANLTITYDQQIDGPLEIVITGSAGTPTIVTTGIPHGVLYVPYSALLQHNNMHAWNTPRWQITGVQRVLEDGTTQAMPGLPAGLELLPNGEIYGVPREMGNFLIDVMLINSAPEFDNVTRQFTLEILENTDDFVLGQNDPGFEVQYFIPAVVTEIREHTFISYGANELFIDLWLNGVRLTEGVHYTDDSGSTVITVHAITFEDMAVPGRNTIAMEFREVGEDGSEGALRRTAQNFYLDITPGSGGGNNGGGNNGGGNNNGGNNVGGNDNVGTTSGGGNDSTSNEAPPIPQSARPAPAPTAPGQNAAAQEAIDPTVADDEPPTPIAPTPAAQQPEGPQPAPAGASLIFSDINTGDWFHNYVTAMIERGLMQGTAPGQFDPHTTTSRAMIVQLLYNLNDQPAVSGANTFTDIAPTAWYADAVTWANAIGVVSGFGDGTFGSGGDITRAHLALILDNYANITGLHLPQNNPPMTFADTNQIPHYALDAIVRFNQAGIIGGYPDGSFAPGAGSTRAELATMLYRFLEATGQ